MTASSRSVVSAALIGLVMTLLGCDPVVDWKPTKTVVKSTTSVVEVSPEEAYWFSAIDFDMSVRNEGSRELSVDLGRVRLTSISAEGEDVGTLGASVVVRDGRGVVGPASEAYSALVRKAGGEAEYARQAPLHFKPGESGHLRITFENPFVEGVQVTSLRLAIVFVGDGTEGETVEVSYSRVP